MDMTPPREIGRSSAPLLPNRFRDHPVWVRRGQPGIIILVHGVNDVGTTYHAFDNGLCAGLNERLSRTDLYPNDYTLPVNDEPVVPDPDKVYYRLRANTDTYSPVIPFYWGYRAHKLDIGKELLNNEVVDIHGNRLDRDFAKGGGMFANATSTIPDMFGGNFNRNIWVLIADLTADDAHRLKTAPDRRYMALAAKRLAALIDTIRLADPDDTVTVIGHSQGCLVALLAQAWASRAADCLVLNHPPYGLHEPFLDYMAQSGSEQQTTRARVETLVRLVDKVCRAPHPTPALESLNNGICSTGCAGSAWSPQQGQRPHPTAPDEQLVFAERDNRGKVYLYFCPHDLTVGLANVQGIGTFGVPDSLSYPNREGVTVEHPVLDRLGARFLQRVWTWRQREDNTGEIGLAAPYHHTLRLKDEPKYDRSGITVGRSGACIDERRRITGEALNPKFKPDLHHGELGDNRPADPRYQGHIGYDPIDASIAVASTCLDVKTDKRPDLPRHGPLPSHAELEAAYNNGRPEGDRTVVHDVDRDTDGIITVKRTETPFEARRRYQDDTRGMENSYHSSIVGNPEHHRWVTAMDVAVGQAKSLEDDGWRALLIAMADWRRPFEAQDKEDLHCFGLLPAETQSLIDATWRYYDVGDFPTHILDGPLPTEIVSETRAERSTAREQA
ncbi:DUF3274 domain-containing protein [Azoarcus olearius]|uniref:DUF3274 domain-containing protein n=1 Tax=Azoarcus sp. (strain BH72) TaxID=418699 RepID=A1K9Q3_AZOSB|nr:DUF3274 domain-containing protein [Azoarcus olearius]CAL95558.1 conserved hypothetical protein [Azoarcus olearius]